MKRLFLTIAAAVAIIAAPLTATAQYWQLTNQATDMLSTILNGGLRYKGYAEVSYMKGIGENNGDFLGVSTSHGSMFGKHFYMGLGLGVDWLQAHVDKGNWAPGPMPSTDKEVTRNGCVLPIFSDFRAIIGTPGKTNLTIGVKMGASFMVSSNYIAVNRGYITSSECFYLKPSIGVRIPVNANKPKQAVNVAVSYQLITPTYRPYYGSSTQAISLNSFGVTAGFEW